VPFNSLGDNIGADEVMNIEAGRLVPPPGSGGGSTDDILAAVTGEGDKSKGGRSKLRSELPFIDTHSKWHSSVPVEEVRDEDGLPIDMPSDDDELDEAASKGSTSDTDADAIDGTESNDKPADPIDLLTVKRLKEILKEQGLKVSGNKQVLRDRLRSAVNSKLNTEE